MTALPKSLPAWAEIPRVCAWCHPGEVPEYERTSHAICPECLARVRRGMAELTAPESREPVAR